MKIASGLIQLLEEYCQTTGESKTSVVNAALEEYLTQHRHVICNGKRVYIKYSKECKLLLRQIVYRKKKKNGLCVACGKPVTTGNVLCNKCSKNNIKQLIEKYRKNNPEIKRQHWNRDSIISALQKNFTSRPKFQEYEKRAKWNPNLPNPIVIYKYWEKFADAFRDAGIE